MKIEPTAFHKWIWQQTEGHPVKIANLLVHEIVENQNAMAFELLAATGDIEYTKETFIKASDLLIDMFKPDAKRFYITED